MGANPSVILTYKFILFNSSLNCYNFQLLLECQFDQNDKLKSSVNKSFDADELRMQPIGRDLDGFIYWYHEVRQLRVSCFYLL